VEQNPSFYLPHIDFPPASASLKDSLVKYITLKVTVAVLKLKLHKPFDSKSKETRDDLNDYSIAKGFCLLTNANSNQ
jgi:hypothetical protein